MPQEIVPFPRASKPSVARLSMAQQQLKAQQAMLDENVRMRGASVTDLVKRDQPAAVVANPKKLHKQAGKETFDQIDRIFSSAFAHIPPGIKLEY